MNRSWDTACSPSCRSTATPRRKTARWSSSRRRTLPRTKTRKRTTRTPPRADAEDEQPPETQDPLRLYVRQIGDGRLLTAAEERELARRKDLGDERAKRRLDRVEPPARHVDRAQLHERGRPAAGPDPGGQPRSDPGGREVRRQPRLQALHLRDLVDPPGDHARDRRPGQDDPPARCTSSTRCGG